MGFFMCFILPLDELHVLSLHILPSTEWGSAGDYRFSGGRAYGWQRHPRQRPLFPRRLLQQLRLRLFLQLFKRWSLMQSRLRSWSPLWGHPPTPPRQKCTCYNQLMSEFQTSYLSILLFCLRFCFFVYSIVYLLMKKRSQQVNMTDCSRVVGIRNGEGMEAMETGFVYPLELSFETILKLNRLCVLL